MSFKFTMAKSSITELENGLQAELKKRTFLGMKGLKEIAEEIMNESQAEVPVDTSALKQSAFVEEQSKNILLGYGGPADTINPKTHQSASEYMYYVHEDLSAHHNTGKAKFLEDPLTRHTQVLENTLANKMRT